MRRIKQNQQGFTLTELMVAMFLGLLLLTSVISIYLSTKQSYGFHQALEHMQQTGLIATHLITQDIRNGGFTGCSGLTSLTQFSNTTKNPQQRLFIPGVASFIPQTLQHRIVPNSKVLLIGEVRPPISYLKAAILSADEFKVMPTFKIIKPTLALISDCQHARLFIIKKTIYHDHTVKIITSDNLSDYQIPAIVAPVEQIAYFITQTKERNQRGEPIYQLSRKDLLQSSHHPDGLLQGISKLNLRFTYGASGASTKIKFENSQHHQSKKDAGKKIITGVEVNLLLDSMAPLFHQPHSYVFMGQHYQAKDLQLHKQWSFYVALRNQRE